jgi:hypothetical protein
MKTLAIALSLFSLSSCAAMTKDYQDTYCNYDGAYKKGTIDFAEKGKMDPGSLYPCEPEQKKEAERGYRDGFRESRKAAEPGSGNIIVNLGGRGGTSATASSASGDGRSCVSAYGQKKCGHDCKAMYGKIECGRHPGDNCVAAFGQIRCGENCRESFGRIECD